MTTPSTSPTTYTGHCHCGSTRYTVTLPRPLESKPTQIKRCNCSICSRNGYINIYPKTEDLTFTRGSMDELASYEFGNHAVKHRFCQTCGNSLFVDARSKAGIVAVNIRNLNDVDFEDLEYDFLDMREKSPRYELKD